MLYITENTVMYYINAETHPVSNVGQLTSGLAASSVLHKQNYGFFLKHILTGYLQVIITENKLRLKLKSCHKCGLVYQELASRLAKVGDIRLVDTEEENKLVYL